MRSDATGLCYNVAEEHARVRPGSEHSSGLHGVSSAFVMDLGISSVSVVR